METSIVTVWFDGSCPLCTREIAAMRKLDRKGAISFIDVMSNGADCPLDRTQLLARFHAEENGQLLSGAQPLQPCGALSRCSAPLVLLRATNGCLLAWSEPIYSFCAFDHNFNAWRLGLRGKLLDAPRPRSHTRRSRKCLGFPASCYC